MKNLLKLFLLFCVTAYADSWVILERSSVYSRSIDLDTIVRDNFPVVKYWWRYEYYQTWNPKTRMYENNNKIVQHFYPIEFNCLHNISRFSPGPYYENGIKKDGSRMSNDWEKVDLTEPDTILERQIICRIR